MGSSAEGLLNMARICLRDLLHKEENDQVKKRGSVANSV